MHFFWDKNGLVGAAQSQNYSILVGRRIEFSIYDLNCNVKGELRGKNEVILYSRPIFSTSIFGNSFH